MSSTHKRQRKLAEYIQKLNEEVAEARLAYYEYHQHDVLVYYYMKCTPEKTHDDLLQNFHTAREIIQLAFKFINSELTR